MFITSTNQSVRVTRTPVMRVNTTLKPKTSLGADTRLRARFTIIERYIIIIIHKHYINHHTRKNHDRNGGGEEYISYYSYYLFFQIFIYGLISSGNDGTRIYGRKSRNVLVLVRGPRTRGGAHVTDADPGRDAKRGTRVVQGGWGSSTSADGERRPGSTSSVHKIWSILL